MNCFHVVNILDMIEAIGEDELKIILSEFSCDINPEIENFVKNNAIDFAKQKISITYLIIDNTEKVRAIFTLTHKAIEITNQNLSKTMQNRLKRYAKLDENTNSFTVSAFLIAQFGKSTTETTEKNISGNSLMDHTFDILMSVQHDIGGGLVYLECEDKPKLLNFYQNEENRFHIFGERFSEAENTKYIQLLKFL